jgi:hypothetical protein
MLNWSGPWEASHGLSEEYSGALGDTDGSSVASAQVCCDNSPDKEQQYITEHGNDSRIIVYRNSSRWLQDFGMLLTHKLRTGETTAP